MPGTTANIAAGDLAGLIAGFVGMYAIAPVALWFGNGVKSLIEACLTFSPLLAGADGLHTHKSSLRDLEDLVKMAHRYGLLVDAYIGRPSDLHTFGLPAETPEEVCRVARQMEEAGADMIGMMTGMSYEGVAAGEIPTLMKERVLAMVETVKVPTLAEGGINTVNFRAFKDTKVNILVVGTAIDNMVEQAAQQAVRQFL